MAKEQKFFDRLVIYIKRSFKSMIRGLRPTAIKGRISGPKVLVNSIPKSGTNLLENALFYFPIIRRRPGRTLVCPDYADRNTLASLKKITKGEFVIAHIGGFPEVISLCREQNIKVLFMVRDPHDILVSHYKYVTEIDTIHQLSQYYRALPSDDDRLMASIKGVPDLQHSIGDVLDIYKAWLADDNTLVIRFEDLIGSKGGGDDTRQLNAVRYISQHLGIDVPDEYLQYICENIYSAKTATFRSGKIKAWEKHFKPEHIDAFNRQVGDLLDLYGYK